MSALGFEFKGASAISMRIHYGWIVTLACSSFGVALAGVFASFAVFLDPLITEFGWSNTVTSSVYSINWITHSVSGLLMGAIVDRRSPRLIIGVAGFLSGLGMALSSYTTAVWQLYLSFGIIGGIGAGATWIPTSATVMRWFKDGRSMNLAVSIVGAGTGLGIAIMPLLAGLFVTLFGWRQAYLSMAVLVWGTTGFTVALARAPATSFKEQKFKLYLRELLGKIKDSRTFWILASAFALGVGVARQDVMVHLVSFVASKGLPYSIGVLSLAIVGAASIFGRLFLGGLAHDTGEKTMLSLCFVIQGLSTLAFIFSQGAISTYFLSILYGIAYGGTVPQIPLIVRKSFGARHFGAIFGLLSLGTGLGGVIGPTFVGGYLHDLTGDYSLSFFIETVVCLLAAGLGFVLIAMKECSEERENDL